MVDAQVITHAAITFLSALGAAFAAGTLALLLGRVLLRAYDTWAAKRDIRDTWKDLLRRRLG